MIRKDYILRLYEEFGKFLGILLGLKQQNKWEELEELIKESSQKYSGIEIEFVEGLSDNNLPEFLIKNHNLSVENMKMLADLLYEKGLFYAFKLDENNERNCNIKAYLLYRHVKANALDSDFSLDMHYKMLRLEKYLEL